MDNDENFFDSDEESGDEDEQEQLNHEENDNRSRDKRPHDCPNSYAWLLLRLTLMLHMKNRLTQFLTMCGFDYIGKLYS